MLATYHSVFITKHSKNTFRISERSQKSESEANDSVVSKATFSLSLKTQKWLK